jgi:phage baseplate assembly protein W
MANSMTNEFVGSGWGFPLRLSLTGGIAMVTDEREIAEAIRIILGTSVGERPMRPEFGSRIYEFVFDEADAATASRLAFAVREALERWEPRIDLDAVDVTVDDVNRNLLYIDINYHIKDDNDPRNLVFPFYVIPEEAAEEEATEESGAAA